MDIKWHQVLAPLQMFTTIIPTTHPNRSSVNIYEFGSYEFCSWFFANISDVTILISKINVILSQIIVNTSEQFLHPHRFWKHLSSRRSLPVLHKNFTNTTWSGRWSKLKVSGTATIADQPRINHDFNDVNRGKALSYPTPSCRENRQHIATYHNISRHGMSQGLLKRVSQSRGNRGSIANQ